MVLAAMIGLAPEMAAPAGALVELQAMSGLKLIGKRVVPKSRDFALRDDKAQTQQPRHHPQSSGLDFADSPKGEMKPVKDTVRAGKPPRISGL
jgi:hypothetical protein